MTTHTITDTDQITTAMLADERRAHDAAIAEDWDGTSDIEGVDAETAYVTTVPHDRRGNAHPEWRAAAASRFSNVATTDGLVI